MNTRPWLSLMATVLHGPRFVAARPATTSERAWTPWQPAPTPTPTPTPTPASRVEEFVIVLIMLHFAVGMLGILFGL